MLVVSPTRFNSHPIGWRGCDPRTRAPRPALPRAATLTSGQPWIPIDSVVSSPDETATSAVSNTARRRQAPAMVQAIRGPHISARLLGNAGGHRHDHLSA